MTTLHNALQFLAARCDGAQALDGRGFNKLDSDFGKKMATLPEAQMSPRQKRAAWKMIEKYKAQLAEAGIDYDAIPVPALPLPGNVIRKIRLATNTKSPYLIFDFTFDRQLVEAIKLLPGRRFEPGRKYWYAPLTAELATLVIEFASQHGFDLQPEAYIECERLIGQQAINLEGSQASTAELTLPADGLLGGELRPFQKAGVVYALRNHRVLIGDEMGLGKTVQALATLEYAFAYPAIVVCPASVKYNWQRECQKWLPRRRVVVLNGSTPVGLGQYDIIILNYDILEKHFEALKAINPQAVVLDESHYCKNYKAKRTKVSDQLAHLAPYRMLLSGTAIINRPHELISQLQILDRLNDLGGFWPFAHRYCAAEKTRYGWDMTGADHLDELNTRLRQTCYIRREKSAVLTELPPKQRNTVILTLKDRANYEKAERVFLTWLRENRGDEAARKARKAEQLVKIEVLKQVIAAEKLEAAIAWVVEFLMASNEKLVIFGNHQAIIEKLGDGIAEAFEKESGWRMTIPFITGNVSAEDRQVAVDRFQNDATCRVIILNMAAGGIGLTLTAASQAVFLELGWTPALHDQAEDRIHRIGQESHVTIWYLLSENTIENRIQNLLEEKRAVVSATLSGGGGVGSDESVLDSLIEEMEREL